MARVLAAEPVSLEVIERLRAALPEVALEPDPGADEVEFRRRVAGADVLLVVGRPIGAAVLEAAQGLRLVQFLGAGFDSVDLAAARARGVLVGHAPGANAGPVAEQAILLMLALLKRFREAEQATRAGRWPKRALMHAGLGDLADVTVGLVGLGHIGQALARRLRAFGSRVVYTSRHRAPEAVEQQLGVSYLPFGELLETSDVVSLHLPLTAATERLIGAAALARMKPGAFLVNTARGGLVDEAALRAAILGGHLAGAALDVIVREEDGGNPFTDLPNVLVTPHLAGASAGAVRSILGMVVENVTALLTGRRPPYLVDLDRVLHQG